MSVLPSVGDHWLRDSVAVDFLDRSLGEGSSFESCGIASFATFFGKENALRHLSQSWTNRTQMGKALINVGARFKFKKHSFPSRGLCLIQWTGPWVESSFRGSDLAYTHWIAVAENYVFDINWGGWLPFTAWEDVVIHSLLRCNDKATGWTILSSFEL